MIPAVAQDIAGRANGLPALTIKDVKVITTSAGGRYRWIFLKIVTSEPGLYGIVAPTIITKLLPSWPHLKVI